MIEILDILIEFHKRPLQIDSLAQLVSVQILPLFERFKIMFDCILNSLTFNEWYGIFENVVVRLS